MKEALAIIGATVMLFACDRSQDREPLGSAPSATPSAPIATNPVTPAVPTTAAPPTIPRATFTDAQTLAVLDAANAAEVEQSNEAVKRTARAKVKTFAQRMITAHTKTQKDLAELATTYGLTKEPCDASRKLQGSAKQSLSALQSATATDFDRQYVEAMISEHQALLDMIETRLLPSAQNPELKNELEKIRDEVRDQIQMARDIRVALSKA